MNPLEATSVSDFLAVGIASANFQVDIYSVDGDLLGEYVHNTGVYTPGVTLGTSKQIYLQVSGVDSIAAGAGYFSIELHGSGVYLELYVNYEPVSGDSVYFDENCVAYSDEALTTIILGEYHIETSIALTEAASTDLEEGSVTQGIGFAENDLVEDASSVNQILDDFIETYFEEIYASELESVDISEDYFLYASGTGDYLKFREFIDTDLDNNKGTVEPIFVTDSYIIEIVTGTNQSISFDELYEAIAYAEWGDKVFIKETTRGVIQLGKFESNIYMDKVVIYDSVLSKILPIEGE